MNLKATLTLEGNISTLAHALNLITQHGGELGAIQITGGNVPSVGKLPETNEDDDNEPANASAPDLDKTGLPWDERIHAKTKAVNGDGTWKKRRGRDEVAAVIIEKELREMVANRPAPQPSIPAMPPVDPARVAPSVPFTAPEQPQLPVTPPAAPAMPQGDNAPAPQVTAPNASLQMPANPNEAPAAPATPPLPPVTPPAAPEAPAAPAGIPTTPGELMAVVQAGLLSGAITPDYMQKVVAEVNAAYSAHNIKLNAITEVFQQPFLVDYIAQLFKRDGKIS